MIAQTSTSNGLSSISALTLSQPEAIASLVALGIIAAGTVVAIVHKKWENYEEKKHKEEIEDVNRRYKHFLEKIEVPGYGVIQGFPEIFKFGPEKDSKSVDSLHYTVDEINDIGSKLPQVDPTLSAYRQSILNALLKLKEYYLSRDNHNDVTAGVLSYLLNILQNRCLCFSGYDFDSAYLSALTDFIDDYASKEGRVNSQHFDRLQPVYAYLMDAKQLLDKHKESLSLSELIEELRETCIEDSNRLIRLLVKMVIPEVDRDLAFTVTIDELSNNIIRKEYIKSEVWGAVLSKYSEINLPNSIFKEWIMGLAKYFQQSLSPSSILKEKNVMPPANLFAFTNWAKTILLQKEPSNKDRKSLNKGLDLIRSVFKNSRNFINTKLSSTEKKPEFVVVTENLEVIERTEVMANFAHLIHAIISLQAFCSHLLHSIKQLGAIYINDPHHFIQIFTVFDNLCSVVGVDLKKVKQSFVEIAKDSKNTMRLAKEGLFPKEINTVLESVEHMLIRLGAQVKEYKNKHTESSEARSQNAAYEMLTVAQFFETIYALPKLKLNPTDAPSIPSVTEVPAPEINKKDIAAPPPIKKTATMSKPPSKIMQMETVLNNLSNQVNNRIYAIKKERPKDPKSGKYQNISNALRILKIKSIEMLNEEVQDEEREDKANKTYNLVVSLYQTTLTFLSLSHQEQTLQANTFIKKIHTELNSPENSSFIDKHRDSISKFIYEHFGFFQTTTRIKLSSLEQAYDSIHIELV